MGRVDALLPNGVLLLESVLIYFLISKIVPWVDEDKVCWCSGAIYWVAILVMYIICVLVHVKVLGGWIISFIASVFVPILCLALNPKPIHCAKIVKEEDDLNAVSTIFALVSVIIFGLVSLKIICASRGQHYSKA